METHPFNLSIHSDSVSDTMSAFEIDDDIRHLLFETKDALFLRPYIGLVGVDYVEIDAQIKSGLMFSTLAVEKVLKFRAVILSLSGRPFKKSVICPSNRDVFRGKTSENQFD